MVDVAAEDLRRDLGEDGVGTGAHVGRADLVVVHEASRRIEAVIAAGRLVWASGEAGGLISARGRPGRMAAE